ncbi:MAG: metabolite traffic protein EboE [Acidimicrobiia bacterium]
MRFRHDDGSVVHLAYCTNVHPAEDTDGLVAQLSRIAGPVRTALVVPVLGVGLWLPAPAAAALAADPAATARLRGELDRLRLEVVTMNGFPSRGFSEPVVKHAVYQPDWTDPARAAYTLDLARVLAGLLPDDAADGSISTLPLAWRKPWDDERATKAVGALTGVAEGLAALAGETGRTIRLGLEPEPGCVLERVAQAATVLGAVAPEWIGVCLDACHLAVAFEDPAAALEALDAAGVAVVKAQVSNALEAREPRPRARRTRLRPFVEERFLHQTREKTRSAVVGVDDLGEALGGGLPGIGDWRIHFHMPVHHAEGTTQPELTRTLDALVGGSRALTHHLEIETYTWSVLPDPPKDDAGLVAGLVKEIAWTRDRLLALGLERLP